jgi:hypothetical protein
MTLRELEMLTVLGQLEPGAATHWTVEQRFPASVREDLAAQGLVHATAHQPPMWEITERGRAFLEHVRQQPLPELEHLQVWKVPK